jgi:hypothetical protein
MRLVHASVSQTTKPRKVIRQHAATNTKYYATDGSEDSPPTEDSTKG